MTRYTLYGMGSPNVVKLVMLLEELGLAYTFRQVDLIAGEQHDAAFRAMAPNGKVPVLVEHREEGDRALFESGAILIDLAERHGQFRGQGADERAVVLQWLMFQMSGAGPMFGQAIHFTFATDRDGYGKARFTGEMDRLLGVVEGRLSATPYLAGEDYSVADMALWPWIRTLRKFFPDRAAGQGVSDWFDRIAGRPATQRTLDVMAPVSRTGSQRMRDATPDQLDRYFGRSAAP